MRLLLATVVTLGSLLGVEALAQEAAPPPDAAEAFLEYSRLLQVEAKAHREFLENLYNKVAAMGAIIIVAFGGIISWLGWKTRADVERKAAESVDKLGPPMIEKEIGKFQQAIKTAQESLEQDIEYQQEDLHQRVLKCNKKLNVWSDAVESHVRDLVELQGKKQKLLLEGPADKGVSEKTILWVDDYPENNLVPKKALEAMGLVVTLAKSTEKGSRLLSEHTFDLVISDMGRGANPRAGLDLLQLIRKSKNKTTPVMFYTSRDAIKRYGPEAKRLGAKGTLNGAAQLLFQVRKTLAVKLKAK